MKNSIALTKDGSLRIKLLIVIGKDDDFYIALVPSLKLSARSKKSKSEAETDLKKIIDNFFKYYSNQADLESELLRLGWDGIQEPDTLTLPRNLMQNKHQIEEVEYNPC